MHFKDPLTPALRYMSTLRRLLAQQVHDPLTASRGYASTWSQRFLHPWFPAALWIGSKADGQIALTFDDGPHEEDSLQVLKSLAHLGISATFFYVGERVERHPEIVRQAAELGHQIGIHGYRHRAFPLEAPEALRAQLAYTQALLCQISGLPREQICAVRPPFGLYTPAILRSLVAWGYRPVMWSVVPFHWLQTPERSLAQVESLVRPGSVLVLHEGLGGPSVAELCELLVTRLQGAGYSFVSINEMWQRAKAVSKEKAE